MLQNREEAGRILAERLRRYHASPNTIVLALPRGGVVVGAGIAAALHLPLDVVITRKIGAPANPEYALGALSETGLLFLNQEATAVWPVTNPKVEEVIERQRKEISRQQQLYRQGQSLPQLTDKTVILVDDGIATGATFRASIETVKAFRPQHLIAAIPVGPKDSLARIGREVDDLIVLEIPEAFCSVGEHYREFQQVEDREVIRCLVSNRTAG